MLFGLCTCLVLQKGRIGSLGILKVDQVFNLAHALSFLDAVLFSFLVPAPLIDLGFGKSSLDRKHK
jgi:hypothetical protein